MIPILLKQDAITKIGWLAEASSCRCTEERNGIYELELQYPMLGTYAADLIIDRYIKAKPNSTGDNQIFHIRKVSKPINGMFTVSCDHVSYALSGYPVPKVEASGNAQVAINAILTAAKNQLGKDTGFEVRTTDITLSSSISLANVSARAALGGVNGSVLDVFGGEYEFDNYTIKLHKARGADNGVRIAYGRNMTELKCDIDMDAAYTGIYGYIKNDEVDLKSYVSITNASGINAKTLIRDFSSDFSGGEITQAKLDSAVSAYVSKNDINSPSVSMTVSFVDLSQSPEYASFSALEAVNLCDTVKIYHKDLDIDIKAKVIKTTYDVLRERYTSIKLGSPRANFADVIRQTVQEAADAKSLAVSSKSEITAAYEKAIADATAAITGNSGGYIRLNPSENPQELLIMDTLDISTAVNIWRFNLSGFGHSSGGYSGPYRTAATQDGHIVADFIDTGTLTANIIKAGIMQSVNGQFSFNLETGHISASDVDITGGDINLDGGSLSIVNDDGYKADLSGGVLDLYQGAGTGSGTGYKYLSFAPSLLLQTGLGTGDWYASLVLPPFDFSGNSSKGLRIGTSGDNASAVLPTVGDLQYNWNTDFAIFEKEKLRVRRCVETNEPGYNQFAGLIHHRPVGGLDTYSAAFGVGSPGGKASGAVEVYDQNNNMIARSDVYQNTAGEVTLMLSGTTYTGYLIVGNDGVYVKYGNNTAKKIS